jgi:hypothetical protein
MDRPIKGELRSAYSWRAFFSHSEVEQSFR